MYIKSAVLFNIRSIKKFDFDLDYSELAGWHVLLGDNGSGKSSVLRAMAASIIGPDQIAALRQNWDLWLSNNEKQGAFFVSLHRDTEYDGITGGGGPGKNYHVLVGFDLERKSTSRGEEVVALPEKGKLNPERYVWGQGSGWFSAAYGPFRRFAGGNKDHAKLFYSHPRLAAHLSIFGEDVALTECLDWLISLKFKLLENKPEGKLLERVIQFVNSGELLPGGAKIAEVTSDGIFVSDAYGNVSEISDLSDGYRSVLSMTFELLRQLVYAYPRLNIFKMYGGVHRVVVPGVVLIDEIDVHLHPTWQRRIGHWFTSMFPSMQFIVTTHSPLVCQAASRGSVWRLPSSEGNGANGGRVVGDDLERLLYGDLATAYSTRLFGMDTTRSEESLNMMQELAVLSAKEMSGGLTPTQRKRVFHLREILGSSLPGKS